MTNDETQAELLDHAHGRTASQRSKANRRRGADAERQVVRYLRANGYPDARRYLAGDGRQPGDLDWHPLVCLEVKDRKESAWPSWCRQATAEARPGMVPVVVRRTRTGDNPGEWECRVDMVAWLTDAGGYDAFQQHGYALTVSDRTWWAMPFADMVAAVARLDQDAAA